MTETTGVHLEAISFAYGKQDILRSVTLDAPANKITAVLGPSGSGKTTALRLIAGLERADQGTIHHNNVCLSSEREFIPAEKRSVGYAFQDNALWPEVALWRQFDLALLPYESDAGKRKSLSHDWLSHIHLGDKPNATPETLSGGEQRRVSLARALIGEPCIVLLDEPLSSVEGPMRLELSERIRSARSPQRSVILVTHHRDEAMNLADHLVIMAEGHVLQQGATASVVEHPASESVARLLGYTTFVPASITDRQINTALGSFPASDSHPEAGTAAWFSEHLQINENKQGLFSCVACFYQGPYYSIVARQDDFSITGTSMNPIAPESRVDVSLLHSPAWIPIP